MGIHPRKSLGQNFLINEPILEEIAAAVVDDFAIDEIGVLEIGSGPGGLTESLARRVTPIVGVEIDEELCEIARRRLQNYPDVTIIPANILDESPGRLMKEAGHSGPYVACGNLPYYITQPVIRHLLTAERPPDRIVTLVQREVAQRIAGGAGKESLLSLSVKLYGQPKLLFEVSPSMFWPIPKVHSAVVLIDRKIKNDLGIDRTEFPDFIRALQAGFAQPRKQLHNGLSGSLGVGHQEITALLTSLGVDSTLRPQHLNMSDWVKIYVALKEKYQEILMIGE